jgi:hypothetical protein
MLGYEFDDALAEQFIRGMNGYGIYFRTFKIPVTPNATVFTKNIVARHPLDSTYLPEVYDLEEREVLVPYDAETGDVLPKYLYHLDLRSKYFYVRYVYLLYQNTLFECSLENVERPRVIGSNDITEEVRNRLHKTLFSEDTDLYLPVTEELLRNTNLVMAVLDHNLTQRYIRQLEDDILKLALRRPYSAKVLAQSKDVVE